MIPYEGWCCYINNKRITINLQEHLRDDINMAHIRYHWSKKIHFGARTSKMVDWEALSRAMTGLKPVQQRRVLKAAVCFLQDGKT